jgi:hypothetical protein
MRLRARADEVMLRTSTTILCSVLLCACAGDPDLAGTHTELERAVPRAEWQSAHAGCEDVERACICEAGASWGTCKRGARAGGREECLSLASVEGEPLLGALVDARGGVACVDALSLLLIELDVAHPLGGITPLAGDPSPQPAVFWSPRRPDPVPPPAR